MKKTVAACLIAAAAATFALAQELPGELSTVLFNQQRRLDRLGKGIRRDAFIVTQMVAAARDLQGFDKAAAIDAALERSAAATKRAIENPPSSPQALSAIRKIDDALRRAQENVANSDLGELARTIRLQTAVVQHDLVDAVENARRERNHLADVQKRIVEMSSDLDAATVDAIAASMDFVRTQ